MKYVNLTGTGLMVSRMCLGTMMFGGQTPKEDAIGIIRYAMDHGVNFIDTANVYHFGQSEEIVGEAVAGRRDSVVIATKAGYPMSDAPNDSGLGRKHIMASVDASLRRLKTDYIDLFYMHHPDPAIPVEETVETMNLLIRSGKIRYYGVSNYSAWQICETVEKAHRMGCPAPVVTQTVYNALTRGADDELIPFLKKYGMSMVPYNPLAGGLLTGKHTRESAAESSRFTLDPGYKNRYWKDCNFDAIDVLNGIARENGISLLELAIRWVLSRPCIDSALVGVSKIGQVKENIEITERGELNAETVAACDQAWKMIRGDYFNYYR